MLFETMCHAKNLWTIGDESHMVFEHIEKFKPGFGTCTSNRLTSADADEVTVDRIRRIFFEHLVDRDGRLHCEVKELLLGAPRLLEKTPKNSLRIPLLNEIFPDARYIYLFRDPRENMSSMIEAWRSSDFVTYPRLPGWPAKWSLLLPPDYSQMAGKSLEQIVAFQWQAANQFILDDLGRMDKERWTAVSYAEIVDDTYSTIERLCAFADIPFDEGLKAYCQKQLPLSRYTRSSPRTGKWRMNETIIEKVMPTLKPLIESIDTAVAPHTLYRVLRTGPVTELEIGNMPVHSLERPPSRNSRCHCGSGLRYKHCHGILHSSPVEPTGSKA